MQGVVVFATIRYMPSVVDEENFVAMKLDHFVHKKSPMYLFDPFFNGNLKQNCSV